jgi:hypothetical protein
MHHPPPQGTPEFQGCRYLAVQIELKDQNHPASQVARRVKANLTGFFLTGLIAPTVDTLLEAARMR